jgi:hypothetical protein
VSFLIRQPDVRSNPTTPVAAQRGGSPITVNSSSSSLGSPKAASIFSDANEFVSEFESGFSADITESSKSKKKSTRVVLFEEEGWGGQDDDDDDDAGGGDVDSQDAGTGGGLEEGEDEEDGERDPADDGEEARACKKPKVAIADAAAGGAGAGACQYDSFGLLIPERRFKNGEEPLIPRPKKRVKESKAKREEEKAAEKERLTATKDAGKQRAARMVASKAVAVKTSGGAKVKGKGKRSGGKTGKGKGGCGRKGQASASKDHYDTVMQLPLKRPAVSVTTDAKPRAELCATGTMEGGQHVRVHVITLTQHTHGETYAFDARWLGNKIKEGGKTKADILKLHASIGNDEGEEAAAVESNGIDVD